MQRRIWVKASIRSGGALAMWLSLTQMCMAATLASPVNWGSPDQPWGMRRAITDADRAAIAAYRSGRRTPTFSTDFTGGTELQANWSPVSDDNPSNKSCRRPDSIEATTAGLRLKALPAKTCRAARWSTGYVASKAKYGYGFIEARIKIADIKGLNNAVWLTIDDNFEIDIAEARYPGYIHLGLQYWPPGKSEQHAGMGWGASFKENLASGFHDVGLLRHQPTWSTRSTENQSPRWSRTAP
ncbi:glycoside hydrolase family 16 protein [Bradyrhizobium sp. INPA01-394B]|uniref:Glycoside hydrolase family 16 protein n=1 Tax=Bradyrhizobium campsiandrae TaxID=1729892 RepID=A0ABR7TYH9_9BRAD|nr:glycoside hydrolase family 16 protein [Bradyrhizobium campsiandrae]MBC9877366.1 glycoside hydrolase family 16 protein [Bradyrhizobium campsiandrae]MBC9976656.1 glycoside hydrolase family 16 protein [Bradyrhizobium campsiandrae]